MKVKITPAIILFSLLLSFQIQAQSLDNIQFPPGMNWKKIETDHFIVIFPRQLENKAGNIAAMLESYYPAVNYSLGADGMKWPVIINNTLFYSNAYVMGAPRHSQLYTLPSQGDFMGTGDWLESIWSHELRHIIQNDKMLRGFTAFAYWIAGEYGASAMPHFAIPSWLWEGDAVVTETLLTSSGRGRLAGFERELRADVLSGIKRDYNIAGFGTYASYREKVPSWYVMGYHLCSYIRKTYGIDAFNRIMEISADFSFVPLILNISVLQVTGKSIEDIYSDCLDELALLWGKQLEERQVTDAEMITPADPEAGASFYPLGEFSDGSTAALRTSFTASPALVRVLPGGSIEVMKKINPFSRNISFNGREFCWAEPRRDPRWGNLSTTAIRVYDTETGEDRLVVDRKRYVSPSISPDGKRIAAVEINEELDTSIVILDASSGRLIGRFAEPAGATATQTCWSGDGKEIVYIRQSDWSKSLRKLTPLSRANTGLTKPSGFDIADPEVSGDMVYFVSEETGLENIHSVPLSGGRAELVVSRPYGTASPAGAAGRLLFADYSSDGYSVYSIAAKAGISPGKTSPEEADPAGHVDYFTDLADQEAWYGEFGRGKELVQTSESASYKTEDYWPVLDLFNFHSRVLNLTNSGTGIAVGLQADDILNYSTGRVYAGWDPENSEIVSGFYGGWTGFIPVLFWGGELTTPSIAAGAIIDSSLYGGIWLPVDLSWGIYYHSLSLQLQFAMEKRLLPDSSPLSAVLAYAGWQLTEQSARRDINPPFGISLNTSWYYNIAPSWYNSISASSEVYLPGILPNHGITIGIGTDYNFDGFEVKQPGNKPRGYYTATFTQAFIMNGSLEYTLPVFYPEFAAGSFFYLSRVFANFFTDAALLWDSSVSAGFPPDAYIQTAGIEFYADFHLFGNTNPLRTGLRLVYDLNGGSLRIEDTVLLLGFSLL